MRRFFGLMAGVTLSASLAACGGPAEVAASDAWVRLPAVSGQPGAAYFTVTGGSDADTLVGVSSPAALRTEMHESMKGDHGMMSMAPVAQVAIAPGATVAFAPGGKHVMLFDIGPAVKVGDKLPLALSFASGKRVEVQAQTVGAGASAP